MNVLTKLHILTIVFLLFAHNSFCSNIAIIESKSFHPLQVMEDNWKAIADEMGHTSTILPQTTLNDVANLNGYDMLIVTNGLINLSSTRQNTIQQFLAQGGDVYLQAEYLITQPGSEAFENIVNNLGGSFSWDGEMNGNLIPMNVINELTANYTDVATVDHFWYGAYGSGDNNIIPFLEFNNKHFGFIYCPATPTQGKMITTSDQDWMRLGYSSNLAKNIIAYLEADNSFAIPSVFVSVSNDQPCENELVTFTANVGDTPANVTYQWNLNGTPIPGANDDFYTNTFTDGDQINCTITFKKGCGITTVNTPVLDIWTIYPLDNMPVLNIETTNTNICDGTSVSINAAATNLQGLNNISYEWQLNNQNIPDATNTTLTTNTLNDGDVVNCLITFSDPCNGTNQVTSNSLTFSINQNTTPTLAITSDLTNICAGEEVTFTATGNNLGNAPIFQWSVNGQNTGTNSNTFSTTNLTDGQVVSCIATSNSDCATTPTVTATSTTINVTSPQTPTVTILASATSVCEGEAITFQASGDYLGSNPQFQWQVDGVNIGNNNNTFTTSDLTNGQVVSCWAVTNETCVTATSVESTSITINVTTDATPTVQITATQPVVCEGGSVTFTAIGENLGTNPQYQWMINGTTTGNNSTIFNTIFNTEQTVSCIVTTTSNCGGTTSVNSNEIEITIGSVTLQVLDIQAANCDDANGRIEIEANGGLAPYTYNWSNNTNTNSLTNLSTGNYSVVVTDANGCSAELEVSVGQADAPQIAQVEINHINCSNTGGSAGVIMADQSQDYFFVWKNENEEVIANSQEIQNLTEGLYIVEVINTSGCSVSEEFYIEPSTPLLAEIVADTRIKLGEETQLKVVTNASNASFSWEVNESLSCTDCMTSVIKPTETTTYFVTVTTEEGCEMKLQVTVWVEKTRDVFVPNAFSPNGDGNNDMFTIYGGQDVVRVKTFKVVDRWGEVVFANDDFEVNDEAQGWAGNFGNKKITAGVFIYFAEVEFKDGETYVYKGDVTVTK